MWNRWLKRAPLCEYAAAMSFSQLLARKAVPPSVPTAGHTRSGPCQHHQNLICFHFAFPCSLVRWRGLLQLFTSVTFLWDRSVYVFGLIFLTLLWTPTCFPRPNSKPTLPGSLPCYLLFLWRWKYFCFHLQILTAACSLKTTYQIPLCGKAGHGSPEHVFVSNRTSTLATHPDFSPLAGRD